MKHSNAATLDTLWRAATRHPGVEPGVACAGTAVETRTAKVGGRAFLFLRAQDARFKLGASAAEAAKAESGCKVGAGGWCHVVLGTHETPTLRVMEAWIAESYALMAAPPAAKPRTATKKSAKTSRSGASKERRGL